MDKSGFTNADALAGVSFKAFRAYFDLFEKVAQQIYPNFSLFPTKVMVDESLDSRLKTVDEAKASLDRAVSSVAELRRQAEENKVELARALQHLDGMRKAKPDAGWEADGLKKVAEADTQAFRSAVAMPSLLEVWKERAAGFASGFVCAILLWLVIQFLRIVL